jgi:hypothetical protein
MLIAGQFFVTNFVEDTAFVVGWLMLHTLTVGEVRLVLVHGQTFACLAVF